MTASAPAASRPLAANGEANKWVIALTVMLGAFVAVMDISVVNVALPHMIGSFGSSLSAITGVATGYSIAEIIMLTMAGWWATLLGRKRLYLLSYAVFTVGSILCGTATSYEQMIVYRVIQGIGGGALIPISQAILRESFPHEEQGMAMAVYGMGVVLAPAVGPVLGGWLTDNYGWPWIFLINVPVCALGMTLVATLLRDPPYLRRGVRRVDWVGIALLTVCLTVMQIVLERGNEEDWFESRWIVAGAAAVVVSAAALVVWEIGVDDPVVSFRMLRNMRLSVASSMSLVFGVALFGTTFVLPEFTQRLLGYPAYEAGLVLLPRAIALFVMMPVAGWLYRRVDPRLLIAGGLALLWLSYRDLSRLSLEAGFWELVPALLLMGAGMPCMFVTMSTVALTTVPKADMTEASSIYTLMQRIGGNVGYAVVATLVAARSQFHRARLMEHVTVYDMPLRQTHSAATSAVAHRGGEVWDSAGAALSVVERTVERHAQMMSYNDVAWVFGTLFVVSAPLILLLPSRRRLMSPN